MTTQLLVKCFLVLILINSLQDAGYLNHLTLASDGDDCDTASTLLSAPWFTMILAASSLYLIMWSLR